MKWKRTHWVFRFLSLVLMLSLCLGVLPMRAEASADMISEKTYKGGILDHPKGSVDYIFDDTRMRLVEHEYTGDIENPSPDQTPGHNNKVTCTYKFQKYSGGQWVTDNATPFRFGHTSVRQGDDPVEFEVYSGYFYIDGSDFDADGYHMTDRRIEIKFPQAALDTKGKYHDVTMTVSNFFFRKTMNVNTDKFVFLGQSWFGSLSMYSAQLGVGHTPGASVAYDVTLSIDGAKNTEKAFLFFNDLDQPGINGYTTTPSDCVESIQIKSGIASGTTPRVPKNYLLKIVDGAQPYFYAIENTKNDDSWRSGVSYLPTASGTTYRWSGTCCGTSIGFNPNSSFEVKTQVKAEWPNSPVNPPNDAARVYGDWWDVDSKKFLGLMNVDYSYTYKLDQLLKDYEVSGWNYDWLWDFTSETVGESDIGDNKTFDIIIHRMRYTYSFKPNPPAGKSASDVTNMPNDKTVVAAVEASGKSDATVKSPTLPGYVFKGWSTKTDGSGDAYPGAETMKSYKVFYAQWEKATYKVHFDANGSSNPNHETGEFTQNTTTGTMADQVLQFDVASALTANAFAREGYTFAGWNTKADGSGTPYADQQSVKNLIGYDKSEITLYAQWTKKLGTETITVVSEETGNPVKNVSMKLQKNVNGNWTDVTTGKTGDNGQITVDNLHWFDYRWVMDGVPAGYVKSADTTFRINYNQLSATNQVILYMKHVQIILDSQVSDIIKGEQPPAFLYHIKGVDAAGVTHEYHLMVQTNAGSRFGTNYISDLFAGTYDITQEPVSRYRAETAANVLNGMINGINATVDVLNHDLAEVRFPYTIREYGWFYGVNSITNHLRK